MVDFLWEHLAWWPPTLLVCVGALIGFLEARWPRQSNDPARTRRWPVNLGLYGAGLGLALWGLPSLNDAAIRWGSGLGWGGIAGSSLPDVAKVVLGVVVVDLLQYLLHRLSHAVPLLWRLHQVHHADEAFDVSTSVRHHPLEVAALSVFTLMGCAALGVPVLSLTFYLLLQVAHTAFCHANLMLPAGVDRWLRMWVVTPDMHRIHHSVHEEEGQRNFALVFPWWDHLLGTYRGLPRDGQAAMRVGLAYLRSGPDTGWWGSLLLPARRFRESSAGLQPQAPLPPPSAS